MFDYEKRINYVCGEMLFLVATILIASCNRNEKDIVMLQKDDAATKSQASPRFLKAMQTARDAAGLLDSEPATRSEQDRQIDENEIKFIVAVNATRSESEPDTLMYVFNYVNDAGFAVVSAVGESGEMLAVTEQGHFNSMEEIENDGFRIFMEAATVYTDSLHWAEKDATRGGGQTGPEFLDDFKIEIDTVITTCQPLISVKWRQGSPYNMYCPYEEYTQCPAGCVAIVLGQILSFHEYPIYWTLNYLNGSPTLNVNWNMIKDQDTCTLCSPTAFCTVHQPLAKIIREIGEDVSMNYHAGGSGSTINNARQALISWGYSAGNIMDYSFNSIKSSLNNERPVYMRGERVYGDSTLGHAWVVDGFIETVYTYNIYTQPHGTLMWIFDSSYTETHQYNHINWGWGGNCNGFFSAGCFNTQSGTYDTGCGHSFYRNYILGLKIIPNIRI